MAGMTFAPQPGRSPDEQPPPLPSQDGWHGGIPEVVPSYQPPAGQGAPGQGVQGYGGRGVARQGEEKVESFMGQVDRVGRYPLARRTTLSAGMATMRLDLREVIEPGETVEIRLAAWMSSVRIAVPPGTEVALQVSASVGDARLELDGKAQGVPPTGTRVVITGWAVMTDVRVRAFALDSKPKSGWKWTRSR